jgi:hypothetical protein
MKGVGGPKNWQDFHFFIIFFINIALQNIIMKLIMIFDVLLRRVVIFSLHNHCHCLVPKYSIQ